MSATVLLRDDLAALGSATYVRSSAGSRIATMSALTVNGASESVQYRSWTVPSSELGHRDLTTWLLEASPFDVFLGLADDPMLADVVRAGLPTAAIRSAPGASDTSAQIRWLSERPDSDAPSQQLISRLARRGLLYEPIERMRRLSTLDAARVGALDLSPPLDCYLRREGPVGWPHEFLPYQCDGIRTLVKRKALLLADDMGLGKTVQAAAAMRILIRTQAIENALVVAPASIIGQWYRALKLWAPDLRISTIREIGRAHV